MNTKFNLYQAYGVRYYIIANVEKNEIEIFQVKDGRYQQVDLTRFQLTRAYTVDVNVNNVPGNPG